MKRFSECLAILAWWHRLDGLVPLALATRATPSVSLKPSRLRSGSARSSHFTGTVKNAVTKYTTVKLWLVSGKKSVLKSSGTISGTGTFWFHGQGGQGRNDAPSGSLPGRHGHLQKSKVKSYHQVSLCAGSAPRALTSPPVRRVEIPVADRYRRVGCGRRDEPSQLREHLLGFGRELRHVLIDGTDR